MNDNFDFGTLYPHIITYNDNENEFISLRISYYMDKIKKMKVSDELMEIYLTLEKYQKYLIECRETGKIINSLCYEQGNKLITIADKLISIEGDFK